MFFSLLVAAILSRTSPQESRQGNNGGKLKTFVLVYQFVIIHFFPMHTKKSYVE